MSPPEKREEESPVPPVAGERTWTIYRVRIGRSVGQWQVADETDLVSAPSPVGTTRGETYEVVSLSRLRAAEEERDKIKADARAALNSMFETAKQAMEEPHPLVAMGAYFEYSLGTMGDAYQTEGFARIVEERDEALAERDRLVDRLRQLLAHPRLVGADPEGSLALEMKLAREALASLEQKED